MYTPITYTAIFKADSNIVSEFKYTVEDTITPPEVPQKTGYNGEWTGLPITGGDVTIMAEYTPIIYTVTYLVDKVPLQMFEYTVESIKFAPPAIPEKPGYKGVWEEKEITFGNVTINAVYTLQTYTATFMVEDKIVGTSQFQLGDMNVEEPTIPEKEGYTAKWAEYSLSFNDIIINAIYTPIAYTADFFIGSEKVGSTNFTINDHELKFPDIKERNGYSVEWEKVAIAAKNLTVSAILTPITYYVTFVTEENEIAKIAYTVENKDITAPPPPQKIGYIAKWESYTLTYGDITVNAVYTPISDEELNFKDEFTYQHEDDGSLTVTGYNGKETYLYMPSTHEGLPIKAIGKLAFSGSNITGIKLSEGIETICDEAFMDCSNLTEVLLPESIESIGKNVFAYCGFTEIILPDNISEIGEQAFAFSHITNITLPKKLTVLCASIFAGCSYLKSIVIPSNIKLIEANAFAETALETVTFNSIENWTICNADGIEIPNIDYTQLSDQTTAAKWLTEVHKSRYWKNFQE